MSTDPLTVKSDEARTRFRELLDHAERGGEVRILRYQRPVAIMTKPAPNPLDDRLLAMAAILRGHGPGGLAADADAADQIEACAAYIREAWRGSDDGDIIGALDTIAAYAADLAEIVRDRPSAARMADHPDLSEEN